MNGNKFFIDPITEEPYCSEDSSGPFKLTRRHSRVHSNGKWTTEEIARLMAFLKRFSSKLEGLQGKNRWSFFSVMSCYVATRNTNQCRSYFNKLKKRFGEPSQMLQHLTKNTKGLKYTIEEQEENLTFF